MSPKLFFGKQDTKKEDIRKALALAVEARADFNLDFFMRKRLVLQMKGVCTEIRPDTLRIYLRGDKSFVPPAGMQVHVYFSLRDGRKVVPHDFMCEHLRTERQGEDPVLCLSVPEDMGHNQRRNNVRIPICRDDIPHFKAWYGKPQPMLESDASIRLEWVPFVPTHVDIFDISAGGARLAVSQTSPLLPMIASREMLLLCGDFEARGKTEQLLIAGSVVRLTPSEQKNSPTCVGLRFKRWATKRDGKFHWMHLAENDGIPPLGAWVFHMILTRNRLEREDALAEGLARPMPVMVAKP